MTVREAALACLVAGIAAMSHPAAAAPSCIQTYDRSGAVVGRYCAEGLVDPGGPPETALPQDPADRRDGARAGAARRGASAPGVEIQCGGPKGRCRGTFSLR